MKYDYCPDIDLPLIQREGMFHFNTDSVLLGRFLRINPKQKVLDVGTNNGVLLLYASVHNPKWMYGIDILEEAIECAKENMQINHIENVNLSAISLTDFSAKVDVIICNPPYFTSDHKNSVSSLRTARHQESLTLEVLFQESGRLLDDKGKLYFVYPSDQIEAIVLAAQKNYFSIKRLQFAYKKSKKRSHVVLVECLKRGKIGCVVEEPIIIK